ncbi:type II secretion system F family protein, partial [Vibrio lentus]
MNRMTLIFMLALTALGASVVILVLVKRIAQRRRYQSLAAQGESHQGKSDDVWERLDKFLPKILIQSSDAVSNNFERAGIYSPRLSRWFMPLKYTTTSLGGSALYLMTSGLSTSIQTALIAAWCIITITLPDVYINFQKRALQDKIANQLPYLLDLMSMCVQTGMTVESSIQYLSSEIQGLDKDLSHTVNLVNDRAQLVGLDKALDELYERYPSSEVRRFVLTLKQSLQYGSSIYSVLNNLASDIREVRMLALEEKIGKLSAKMSVPLILFILIPIVV